MRLQKSLMNSYVCALSLTLLRQGVGGGVWRHASTSLLYRSSLILLNLPKYYFVSIYFLTKYFLFILDSFIGYTSVQYTTSVLPYIQSYTLCYSILYHFICYSILPIVIWRNACLCSLSAIYFLSIKYLQQFCVFLHSKFLLIEFTSLIATFQFHKKGEDY